MSTVLQIQSLVTRDRTNGIAEDKAGCKYVHEKIPFFEESDNFFQILSFSPRDHMLHTLVDMLY